MTTYRFLESATPPTAPSVNSSAFIAGASFSVTEPDLWLDGYWWWVCPDANADGQYQPTSPQPFALWALPYLSSGSSQCDGDSADWAVVPASEVESGVLTAGEWNYITLPSPINLAQNVVYIVATGLTGAFPATYSYFGSGEVAPGGVTNAVATMYSDTSGTNPAPVAGPALSQGLYVTASSSSFADPPTEGNQSFNGWIDVQLATGVSANSFRIWPSFPIAQYTAIDETIGYTLANQCYVSQACTLQRLWFFSPPAGAFYLPTRCAVWVESSQTVLAGSDNLSPVWKTATGATAAPGDGWVYCDYSRSGQVLAANVVYRPAVFYSGAGGETWFCGGVKFWLSGAGASGLSQGPLVMASANSWSNTGSTWAYPNHEDGSQDNWWIDVEVSPLSPPTGLLMAAFP